MNIKNSLSRVEIVIISLCWLLVASGCSLVEPDPQESCFFVQNKYEQRVSWKSHLPLKFRVHKDVPEEAKDSILEAAKQWNLIATKNVIEIQSWDAEGSPQGSYADRNPMIFWKKDWELEKSREQARTIIVWTDNKLKDADIWINAKNFQYSYLEEDFNFTKVDLVSLMVHEMGHALGFEHTEDHKSVMYPRLAMGHNRRAIDHYDDLASFSCEYGEEIIKPDVMLAALEAQDGQSPSETEEDETEEETVTPVAEEGEEGEPEEENLVSSFENDASHSSKSNL